MAALFLFRFGLGFQFYVESISILGYTGRTLITFIFEKHERRHHNTKTDIVIPVVGIVVVANRTTQIRAFIVVRTAANNARDVTS